MDGKFAGKVVLVTGASSGIGAATAVAFAKERAKLAIHGRDLTRLKETAALCISSGASEVCEIIADLREFDNLSVIVDRTVEKYSTIDILVNNAALRPYGHVSELQIQDYEDTMNTNVRAPVFLSKYALPHLKKTKGCVVNVSAGFGLTAYPDLVLYSMTKSALDHFTRGLAAECASFGVRINSINPACVDTRMTNPQRMDHKALTPKDVKLWEICKVVQPLGIIPAEVIAENILFLCSSPYTTGITLSVDGAAFLPK